MKLIKFIKQKKHKFAVMMLMAIGTVLSIGIAIVDKGFSTASLLCFAFFTFFAVLILVINLIKGKKK